MVLARWKTTLVRWWPRGRMAKEAAIQHVGQPGQGVPVGGVHGGKGPFDSRPGEPGPHHGIGGDVHVVIEGDEAVVLDLDIGSQGRPRQQQADEQSQAGRSAAVSGY